MYFILYLVIGFLWGCTNAYMKKGCKDENTEKNIIKDIISIFKNLNIIIPYILNQIGSLLYYYLLSESDISLVMPLSNASSFFFTYITEIIIFKKSITYKSILGLILICSGLFMCVNF
ncbi:conserved Plasmodium protein, unknown function [Plasmodium gallinaceum]|uniref:Transmembrane protein 234 n=1 Tax=Plasmodium gallinaceum TaxID=5849 RepID=A0A1J1GMP0_PLAGA|nr:conserved Plasmodium protein, unknown function [Plasmodium gallinaceum]CRG93702.1 conserved Plasmodium protein, unknown function [Plasmodium gallinaceum]